MVRLRCRMRPTVLMLHMEKQLLSSVAGIATCAARYTERARIRSLVYAEEVDPDDGNGKRWSADQLSRRLSS
jgi:hypothetical protein